MLGNEANIMLGNEANIMLGNEANIMQYIILQYQLIRGWADNGRGPNWLKMVPLY